LSIDVDALFVFPEVSCITPAKIVAVTVSQRVIPVTVNSKLVPLFGATSVGPDVTEPVVPARVMSADVNVPTLIGSSKATLKVAESDPVGSA